MQGIHILVLGWIDVQCRPVHQHRSTHSQCTDPHRTQTWNLRLQKPMPYPLGQRTNIKGVRPHAEMRWLVPCVLLTVIHCCRGWTERRPS